MPRIQRDYLCPARYSLYTACHTHGWIYLEPFSWNESAGCLEFPLLLPSQAVDVTTKQMGGCLRASIISKRPLGAAALRTLDTAIVRSLGLQNDTAALLAVAKKQGRAYARLVEQGGGRLLRGATLWEDAAKTLFTTNCSWGLTEKMCERMCSATFTPPAPSGRYPFPPPTALADYDAAGLRRKMPIGYRDEYLKALAQRFSGDPTLDNVEVQPLSYGDAYERVSSLRGFGLYARTHLLLLAGHYERIPVDSVETDYIKRHHRCRDVGEFVARHYRAWGRHQWWGLKLEKMLRHQNWLGD